MVFKTNDGFDVIIDDEDYELVSQYSWWIDEKGYARGNVNGKKVRMHRLIINAKPGEIVDHINHRKLYNKKSNLRIVNAKQNGYSKKKWKTDGHSLYKGVRLYYDKFSSSIMKDGKSYNLGIYADEIDAARAYNRAAKKLFGDYAVYNDVDEPLKKPTTRYFPYRANRSSKKYKGVRQVLNGTWFCSIPIWVDGKYGRKYVGNYPTENCCARAYNNAMLEKYGEGNFEPNDVPEPLKRKHAYLCFNNRKEYKTWEGRYNE